MDIVAITCEKNRAVSMTGKHRNKKITRNVNIESQVIKGIFNSKRGPVERWSSGAKEGGFHDVSIFIERISEFL